MNEAILLGIRAASALLKLKANGQYAGLKDDVEALLAKLTPTLPAKPDGEAWTEDDIHAAAAAARLPWEAILDRSGDGPSAG